MVMTSRSAAIGGRAGNAEAAMRRYPRQLLRLAARPDTHFIAVSEAVKRRAIAYGIAPDKITTPSSIGIDAAKFTPGPVPLLARPPRVVFVGRLVEKKGGCEYLLRAMRMARRRVPEAESDDRRTWTERGRLEIPRRGIGR